MSDYAGQQQHAECIYRYVPSKGILDPDTAYQLRDRALEIPHGPEAAFLINASQVGWTIQYAFRDGLLPGYDSYVGGMWHDLESDCEPVKAFGSIVARSLGVEVGIGDGR